MKKVLILVVIAAFLFAAPLARAEEVESPGLLPTNPYYFVKKFGWGIRRMFTFDPLKKIELDLQITDQKAAEIKKLAELTEKDAALIEAAESYRFDLESLKSRLEALRKTSESPRIESLFEKVMDRISRHEALFEGTI